MKTRKQIITTMLVSTARILARDPLTCKQVETLTSFIESRLDIHGKYGYLFKASIDYHEQLIAIDEVETIAAYALRSNIIATDRWVR